MKLFGVLLPLLVLAAMVLTPRADDNSMARRLGLHRRLRGGLSEAARLKLTRSRWAVPPAPPPSAFTSSDPGEVTIIITTSEDPKQRSGDKAPSVPHHRAAYANSTPDSDYASAITAAAGRCTIQAPFYSRVLLQ